MEGLAGGREEEGSTGRKDEWKRGRGKILQFENV